MKVESSYASLEYNRASKTIRLDRRFEFNTSEDSYRFAERIGNLISFPNLAVYVDPVIGAPEARVSIECSDDSMSLANAHLLLESFDRLH